jgi:hypothetical protein
MKKKVSKKTLRRSIIVASIVAAIALPATVFASLQPLDLNLETIGEEALPQSGPSHATQKALIRVPPLVSATRGIFHNISRGNAQGAINGILGILGQLGLIDPADEAVRVASNPSGDNPYSNPQTPEEVYELQRHVDIVRSEIGQKLSHVVFGPEGQEALSQQLQAVEEAQQVSLLGQQGVVNTYQQSAQQAQINTTYATNVEAKSRKAQSATVSQDVLKALAAQSEDVAKIGAGNSAQLAYLSKAASYQSAQLNAANTQLATLNDKAQVLQVFGASQNYQMAQINAAIQYQNHYQQLKDSLATSAAYQAANTIYIPGLVPKGVAQ